MEKIAVNGLIGVLIACLLGFFGYGNFLKPGNDSKTKADGKINFPETPQTQNQGTYVPTQSTSSQTPTTTRFKDEIVIGSFNIRTFGTGKLNNKKVISSIVAISRFFDVLAIQEVRSSDQTMIPRFVSMINSNGSKYNYTIGPRQGSGRYFEQYVFIWNTDSVELTQKSWVAENPRGKMVREPLVASFRCKSSNPNQAFTFSLANVHTDPHHASSECDELADTFANLQHYFRRQAYPEDDIIMLGDFNLAPNRFRQFRQNRNFYALIPSNVPTNLAGNNTYDNIIFDRAFTTEFKGKAGVFNLMKAPMNLTYSDASSVSDHFPVWGVFSTRENRSGLAHGTTSSPR